MVKKRSRIIPGVKVMLLSLAAACFMSGLFLLRAEAASGSERYAFSDIVTDPDVTAGLETGHASDGYVVARYLGDKERARVTITGPDGSTTPWPLNKDEETVIALTSGSGPYRAMFYEDTGNFNFAAIFETVFIATLKDPLAPFLASDYYAPYTEDSACVKKAHELYDAAGGDEKSFIRDVYRFITSTVVYDEDLAGELYADYRPDPDRTLEEGKGICLDYTALMAAMLRSCGVPARVMTGNFGAYYHSWITCAPRGKGDLTEDVAWQIYDPTLGASNDSGDVARVLGSKRDYALRYIY